MRATASSFWPQTRRQRRFHVIGYDCNPMMTASFDFFAEGLGRAGDGSHHAQHSVEATVTIDETVVAKIENTGNPGGTEFLGESHGPVAVDFREDVQGRTFRGFSRRQTLRCLYREGYATLGE